MNTQLRLWCESQLQRHIGEPCRVTAATLTSSRTALVYRVQAAVGGVSRAYFLKQFSSQESVDVLAERFGRLAVISQALQSQSEITPYVVVAYDPEIRLLLSEEMQGESLISRHRRVLRAFGRHRDEVLAAWRGVGIWLATFHQLVLPGVMECIDVAQLEAYTRERLQAWAKLDTGRAGDASRAIRALRTAARACENGRDTYRPCHADVSGFNIIAGQRVGFIDYDDAQLTLPGLDLSQAVLELESLSRFSQAVPLPYLFHRARAMLVEGYGPGLPDGAGFWLPHLRNLAVYLLTLAARRSGLSFSRLTDELHYRRSIADLRSAVEIILRTDGAGSYWRLIKLGDSARERTTR